MSLMRVDFRRNTTKLDSIIKVSPAIAEGLVKDVAEETVDDINANWSANSPSDPFNPPAVVTGALKRSIRIERRSARGRFAKKADAVHYAIMVRSKYGAALEFGYDPNNLLPRPYLLPAVDRAKDNLAGKFKTSFRFV